MSLKILAGFANLGFRYQENGTLCEALEFACRDYSHNSQSIAGLVGRP
jgi:hypothetical protein